MDKMSKNLCIKGQHQENRKTTNRIKDLKNLTANKGEASRIQEDVNRKRTTQSKLGRGLEQTFL